MKRVLNTIMAQNVPVTQRQRYIYWGTSETKDALNDAAVIALTGAGTTTTPGGSVENGRELRYDRFKTFYNFDMPAQTGKYVTVCIPSEFGGDGKFRYFGLTNQFVLINTIVGFTDHDGASYDMNVYMSYNKINAVISELITV